MKQGFFRRTGKQFADGLWYQNPNLVLLLGMCPTLATTTSVMNALGMGASVTIVLTFSNLLISLLRKFIPKQIRIASFIVIIAGVVSAVDLLLQAYLPPISESLGIFIPLIVVNCVILARAEAFASKNPPLSSAIDGFAMGLGFTASLTVVSVIREIVGSGSIFGYDISFGVYKPMLLIVMPVGGFLTLGCVIALMQHIMNRPKKAHGRAADMEAALADYREEASAELDGADGKVRLGNEAERSASNDTEPESTETADKEGANV